MDNKTYHLVQSDPVRTKTVAPKIILDEYVVYHVEGAELIEIEVQPQSLKHLCSYTCMSSVIWTG